MSLLTQSGTHKLNPDFALPCPIVQYWGDSQFGKASSWTWDNLNLNDELRKGYLKFVDKDEALKMNKDINKATRRLFDNNVVGKHIEIKEKRRFSKYKVLEFNTAEKTHTVSPEAGTGGAGLPKRMDLNALAVKGQIRTPESLIPREVAQRWLAIAGGFRPDRGGIQGQRSDTLVAWPMPKGGNHVIN